MAKWCGSITFVQTQEDPEGSGIWTEKQTKRTYYGDIVRDTRKYQSSDKVNDDITISNQVSIVADLYAMENFQYMRSAEFMKAEWKITDIEIQFPRLTLTLGGLYNNGEQA